MFSYLKISNANISRFHFFLSRLNIIFLSWSDYL